MRTIQDDLITLLKCIRTNHPELAFNEIILSVVSPAELPNISDEELGNRLLDKYTEPFSNKSFDEISIWLRYYYLNRNYTSLGQIITHLFAEKFATMTDAEILNIVKICN